MVVSYRLSIVTVALCVTIRPQCAIECLQRSNQQGWVTFGPNLGVFPLEQTSHVGIAKSERPRLTNGEIIFEEFKLMWSQFTNVADRQTTCDRNTALCTKVHRAVKIRLSIDVCSVSLQYAPCEYRICYWHMTLLFYVFLARDTIYMLSALYAIARPSLCLSDGCKNGWS